MRDESYTTELNQSIKEGVLIRVFTVSSRRQAVDTSVCKHRTRREMLYNNQPRKKRDQHLVTEPKRLNQSLYNS